jgi:Tol biopolymer transport system component
MIVALLALSACASPTDVGTPQPLTADQAATVTAVTMQAPPTNAPVTVTPEAPAELLPHTLYYLSNDGIYRRDNNTLLAQVYRMERDGKTITRLTNEPNGVDGYDVSLVEGTVAFIADNQLVLVNADGSNRRVLVDGGSARIENNPYFYKDPLSHPVFSPDGQTIAYGRNGLNVYDISTGVSTFLIEDQHGGPTYEIYSPVRYFPDGTKLLMMLGQWEAPPVYAVYDPGTGSLVRPTRGERDFCCGGPVWSSDGSSFYGAALIPQYAYRTGEIWWVDSATGAVTTLFPFDANNETMSIPSAPYLAPDGQLYYFIGSYRVDSGYFEPPVLQLVRSAPDGVTDRTVIRNENFVLMNEALWAPDASFVIVASAPQRDWREIGVLELYYTDGQKSPVWLAPFGSQMKWGP